MIVGDLESACKRTIKSINSFLAWSRKALRLIAALSSEHCPETPFGAGCWPGALAAPGVGEGAAATGRPWVGVIGIDPGLFRRSKLTDADWR